MCEVSTALFVASMVTTAAAGAYSADASKKAGQYQADVARQNAALDDYRAEQTQRSGAMAEEAHRAKVRQLQGSQRASFAANGIDLESGTVQDMLDETVTMGEADALTIRWNAMQDAWAHRVGATNSRNEAAFARQRGRSEATGTYLSTAANLAGMGVSGYSSGLLRRRDKPLKATHATTYSPLTDNRRYA